MKLELRQSHVSDGLEFGLQIVWEDRSIGIYAVSLTLARWCWTLELNTRAGKPRIK